MAQYTLEDITSSIATKISVKADKSQIMAKASVAEAEAGTDDSKAMTPKSTKAAILKLAPKQDIKLDVLDIFYPVGTIYQSSDANFNPNEKWGGTWVKIENRFLLGSGSRGVGAQGGEENVTLNVNQIPSHSHSRGTTNITGAFVTGKMAYSESPEKQGIGAFSLIGTNSRTANGSEYSGGRYSFDATRTWNGITSSVGGSQAHNNMPPYEVVNIWKRTA